MRGIVLFVAAALVAAAVPSVASAVVRVDISRPTVEIVGGDQVYTFEVFGTDLDGSDERLTAYTLGVDGLGFSAGGLRFVVPDSSTFGTAGQPIDHPYVFGNLAAVPPIENFGSTITRLQVGASTIGREDEANLDGTRNGLLRFSVLRPATASPGVWAITLDPTVLDMAGLGAPIETTVGTSGVITYIPEPSAAALLLAPPLALLRRRRPAAASR